MWPFKRKLRNQDTTHEKSDNRRSRVRYASDSILGALIEELERQEPRRKALVEALGASVADVEPEASVKPETPDDQEILCEWRFADDQDAPSNSPILTSGTPNFLQCFPKNTEAS